MIFWLAHRNIWLDRLGIFLAEYLPYFIFISTLFLIFSQPVWKKRIFFLVYIFLAWILGRGIIVGFINFLFPQERPFQILGVESLIRVSGFSFPSSHAVILFSLAMVIFYLNKKYFVWYLGLALVNGLARIFVGVHWPIDIVFGAILGILSALAVREIIKPYFDLKVGDQKNLG